MSENNLNFENKLNDKLHEAVKINTFLNIITQCAKVKKRKSENLNFFVTSAPRLLYS